ncbi:MAG: hypothetical protein LBG75_00310 [Candidatus Nomurabacteria bacterium]|jgi:hypothetical protein|nr:hypothetical protein [Candidatus Nomurabacteria bacterium]
MEPDKNGANYWQHDDAPDTNLAPEPLEEAPEPVAEPAEEALTEPDEPEAPVGETVNWDAREHIVHQKGGLWFVVFILVVAALLALAIFLAKSVTFVILIVVSVAALIVYIKRPPREIHYSLNSKGLHIGETLYDFNQFKAFGVLKEDEYFSIVLIPKKHFSPVTTVYFPENQGEAIVDMFGAYLPMQEVKLDAIDRLIRKLRI